MQLLHSLLILKIKLCKKGRKTLFLFISLEELKLDSITWHDKRFYIYRKTIQLTLSFFKHFVIHNLSRNTFWYSIITSKNIWKVKENVIMYVLGVIDLGENFFSLKITIDFNVFHEDLMFRYKRLLKYFWRCQQQITANNYSFKM